ncbi:iron-containing redox enzyme family protein [Ramlibacter sp. XY19]|uniref:iron-containing redox enzyme family protein n=1 Tax=Ramlibacter paludis TaxID=2908000 RepID=UPI0023DCDAC9|nr:iron-containing redox enzyme family protein [Ramlibacter paludis]MCG2591720.1 iron-containing redox enzyme family protein [Ramlibacter paludis]
MISQPTTHSPLAFQRALSHFNARRLRPGKPSPAWRQDLVEETAMRQAEGEFIESLRHAVRGLLPAAGSSADAFMDWFASLLDDGPGQGHPYFDWLAEEAAPEHVLWFLRQEAAGEAGFEDLVAYTQVRLPEQPKLECARNYWDEMGHGKAGATHARLLGRMVEELALHPAIDETVAESLALGNAMVAMATNRRYAFHSVGALGAIELTAPTRVGKVSAAMRRIGLAPRTRAYFDLHAVLDVSHAHAWLGEVIRPLVEDDPACAPFIAEGALIRLLCGQRCFDRYAAEMPAEQAC